MNNNLLASLNKAVENYKTFGFDEAIRHLKNGKKVARLGWNGTKMFIFMALPRVEINAPAADLPETITSRDAAEVFNATYSGPVLCMKTAQNTIVVGWLASQTDLMYEDWNLV